MKQKSKSTRAGQQQTKPLPTQKAGGSTLTVTALGLRHCQTCPSLHNKEEQACPGLFANFRDPGYRVLDLRSPRRGSGEKKLEGERIKGKDASVHGWYETYHAGWGEMSEAYEVVVRVVSPSREREQKGNNRNEMQCRDAMMPKKEVLEAMRIRAYAYVVA